MADRNFFGFFIERGEFYFFGWRCGGQVGERLGAECEVWFFHGGDLRVAIVNFVGLMGRGIKERFGGFVEKGLRFEVCSSVSKMF